jgi:hypothetical protein
MNEQKQEQEQIICSKKRTYEEMNECVIVNDLILNGFIDANIKEFFKITHFNVDHTIIQHLKKPN